MWSRGASCVTLDVVSHRPQDSPSSCLWPRGTPAPSTEERGRPLTGEEISLAASIFDDRIDYSRVRVHDRRYWPAQGRYILAPNGHIYWPGECGNLARSCPGTFIHEMTHVLQHQRGVKVLLEGIALHTAKYATFGKYDPYRFLYDRERPFSSYNIEQQGELARDIYLGLYPNTIA
jgi:hypothetical protein